MVYPFILVDSAYNHINFKMSTHLNIMNINPQLIISLLAWSFIFYCIIQSFLLAKELNLTASFKNYLNLSLAGFCVYAGLFIYTIFTSNYFEEGKYKLLLFSGLLVTPLLILILRILKMLKLKTTDTLL